MAQQHSLLQIKCFSHSLFVLISSDSNILSSIAIKLICFNLCVAFTIDWMKKKSDLCKIKIKGKIRNRDGCDKRITNDQ